MNLLTTVKGNPLSFAVYHEVDGAIYGLAYGEKYSLNISRSLSENAPCIAVKSSNETFTVDTNNLKCGTYCFEIGLVSSAGVETIISPATDINGNILNRLIITERIGN